MTAKCATDELENPLWQYALSVYQDKSIQQQLLDLQDQYQQDVLLVLTALYYSAKKQQWNLSEDDLAEYRHCRETVIKPLRHIRKQLDGYNSELRADILKTEILAEQYGIRCIYHAMVNKENASQLPAEQNASIMNLLNQADCLEITSPQKKEALMPLFFHLVKTLSSL